jgi:hypothetical protein
MVAPAGPAVIVRGTRGRAVTCARQRVEQRTATRRPRRRIVAAFTRRAMLTPSVGRRVSDGAAAGAGAGCGAGAGAATRTGGVTERRRRWRRRRGGKRDTLARGHVVALARPAVVGEAVQCHADCGRATGVIGHVPAAVAKEDVGARAAVEAIVAAAGRQCKAVAAEHVVPAAARQDVGARAALEHIAEVAAGQRVVAGAPVDDRRQAAAHCPRVVAVAERGDKAGAGAGRVRRVDARAAAPYREPGRIAQ